VVLKVDNKSAISLAKNPVFHDRSKHIDLKYHFIRDTVETKKIELEFVPTEHQLADQPPWSSPPCGFALKHRHGGCVAKTQA
jgi:hypothetical protein